MKQIEEALHAMHADNKANKAVVEEKSGLYQIKIFIVIIKINKIYFLAVIRPESFAIVNAVAPDSPAKEAVSMIIFNHELIYCDTLYTSFRE
jgi:hypothetical protein